MIKTKRSIRNTVLYHFQGNYTNFPRISYWKLPSPTGWALHSFFKILNYSILFQETCSAARASIDLKQPKVITYFHL